jgi:hypothetical protein
MSEESRLVSSISDRQFELYALSLERGPDFDPQHIFAAYKVGRGSAAGCILLDADTGTFATLALRRRVDHVRVLVDQAGPFRTPEAALHHRSAAMRGGDAPETLPPGAGRRKLLIQPGRAASHPSSSC